MKQINKRFLSVLPLAILLAGCQSTGSQLAGNVYDANQVNQKQEARTIKIISVMPAQVVVNNSEAKEATKTFGALLGAVAGGVIGNKADDGSTLGTAAGALGGGALGAATSAMVDEKKMVEGVTLAYSENDAIFSSTQVGKHCEFQPGIALIVSTQADETRVQPNATCPKA